MQAAIERATRLGGQRLDGGLDLPRGHSNPIGLLLLVMDQHRQRAGPRRRAPGLRRAAQGPPEGQPGVGRRRVRRRVGQGRRVEIVRKPDGQRGFEVLPRRWVVERTLAWITKCRRLDHDYERLPRTSEAMIKWAMIGLMTRRLASAPGRQPWSTP